MEFVWTKSVGLFSGWWLLSKATRRRLWTKHKRTLIVRFVVVFLTLNLNESSFFYSKIKIVESPNILTIIYLKAILFTLKNDFIWKFNLFFLKFQNCSIIDLFFVDFIFYFVFKILFDYLILRKLKDKFCYFFFCFFARKKFESFTLSEPKFIFFIWFDLE